MYDVNRLLPIFESILGNPKKYPNNEYYFYCPFCNHHEQKLAINLGIGAWHCWVCGIKGKYLLSLLRKLDVPPFQLKELKEILVDELPRYQKSEEKVDLHLALPSEYKSLWKSSLDVERKHALNYLTERGVTPADILRYNVGYCTKGRYANRVIVPSYDESGKLNYFVGRDFFDASSMKYLNPNVSKDIIVFENHINWSYPIVLCEGVMDAIAIKWNAIPLLGKFVPHSLRQKMVEKQVKQIYIALDTDAAREVVQLCYTFLREGQEVFVVNLEDKDPSKVGFEGMQKAIKEAQPITFQDVIAMKLA